MKKTLTLIAGIIAINLCNGQNWVYKIKNNKSKQKDYSGYVLSNETSYFNFPYDGGSKLKLLIINSDVVGKQINFVITKGQISCNEYSNNLLITKFDGESPVRHSYDIGCPSNGGIYDRIGIGLNVNEFIEKIKIHKKLIVQVSIWGEGIYEYSFNIKNFKAEKFLEPVDYNYY